MQVSRAKGVKTMNLNLFKQRIILSVLITISLLVINPSDGEGAESDLDNLCSQFPVNSLCKNIHL